MLKAGVHPKIAQQQLGHSSISVTMDIYFAVLQGLQREAELTKSLPLTCPLVNIGHPTGSP